MSGTRRKISVIALGGTIAMVLHSLRAMRRAEQRRDRSRGK